MTYDEAGFEAAAQLIHGNYSEYPWEARESFGERVWARGTLRSALEKLGPTDEVAQAEMERDEAKKVLSVAQDITARLRERALSQGEALGRIYSMIRPGESVPQEPSLIAGAVQEHLDGLYAARGPIEVSDSVVNAVALAYWGPSVVYDRERLRSAVADALQTR